jgi:hypothetical protein
MHLARALLLLALLTSACSGYQVLRPAGLALQAEAMPLPLVIGLRPARLSPTGAFVDLAPTLAARLQALNLFRTVLYPVRADDKLDLILDCQADAAIVADPWLFEKSFLTGLLLFLPAPVLAYEHHFKFSATLALSTPDGRQLKTYTAESDIPAKTKFRSPMNEVEREGVKAAVSDLLDRLTAQLTADKPFLAAVGKTSGL